MFKSISKVVSLSKYGSRINQQSLFNSYIFNNSYHCCQGFDLTQDMPDAEEYEKHKHDHKHDHKHEHKHVHSHDYAFEVKSTAIKFGAGVLREIPGDCKKLGLRRVGVFTDPNIKELQFFQNLIHDLKRCGIECQVYDRVKVEPSKDSFLEAGLFAREGKFDGYISVGGGSVLDTAKAGRLFGTYPNDFFEYANKPIGRAGKIPGKLPPHIACPTTVGTGSETTGIMVCDFIDSEGKKSKTGIVGPEHVPTLAVIDPTTSYDLPPEVVAGSGFDVLSHAMESFTARPYQKRPQSFPTNGDPVIRPLHQGSNPYSDFGCLEALRVVGKYYVRAVNDPSDKEARTQLSFAATLAGTAMGNAGTHLPHGLSYPISGLAKEFEIPSYKGKLVPHGHAIAVTAPSIALKLADIWPERFLECAHLLGADIKGATNKDAGEIISKQLISIIKAVDLPNGFEGVGLKESHIPILASTAFQQKRVIDNAPYATSVSDIEAMYKMSLKHW